MSGTANACLNCGAERASPSAPGVREFLLGLLLLGVIVGAGYYWFQKLDFATTVPDQSPSAADDASLVCTAMKRTGVATECSVSGWKQTVDVRMDTSGQEARSICAGAVDLVRKQTPRFGA